MLRMDPTQVTHPDNIEEALVLLDQHGERAKLCAGGTDLVPNMKHGLHEPDLVVHLSRVDELRGIHEENNTIRIGAMTTLHAVAQNEIVRKYAPGLVDAASLVAGPQLRRMGTLGGNLCLDTRCLYYNQTHFWRESLGFCLKKDGTQCHVVASGKKCVAAASNDTATMLLCLDTEVEIRSHAQTRYVPLEDFYVADGVHNTVLRPGELLSAVLLKKPDSTYTRKEGYAKLRHRHSIDYPLLSVACRFDMDDNHLIQVAKLVVSALAARPKSVALDAFIGRPLDAALIDEIAALAHRKCTPLTNIADDPMWRKEMVPVFVKRAAIAARDRA